MARGASAERPGTGIPTGHSGTQLPAPTSCLRSPAQQEEKKGAGQALLLESNKTKTIF